MPSNNYDASLNPNYQLAVEQTIEAFDTPATLNASSANRVEIVVINNGFFQRAHNFVDSLADMARTFMRLIGMERLGTFLFPPRQPNPITQPIHPDALAYLERSATPGFQDSTGFHTHTAAGRPVFIPFPEQPDLSMFRRPAAAEVESEQQELQSDGQQQANIEPLAPPTHTWSRATPTALMGPQEPKQPETTDVVPIVNTPNEETKFEVGMRAAGNLILPGMCIAGMFMGTTPYGVAAEIVPEAIQEAIGPVASSIGGAAIFGGLHGSMVAKRGEGVSSMLDGALSFANRAAGSYIVGSIVKYTISTVSENFGPAGLAVGGLLLAAGAIGFGYRTYKAATQPA